MAPSKRPNPAPPVAFHTPDHLRVVAILDVCAEKVQGGPAVRTSRGEVLRFKSPAEFFSENKNIAGFDNPGKSLYTTIRELVENSLDACESISVLPDIDITVQVTQQWPLGWR